MHQRCSTVDVEGIALLPGYRLAFAGWSSRWNGAVATIVPSKNGRVPGVLYRLSAKGLEALDRCEGYPWIYERIPVRVFDDEKQWRTAYAYVLDDNTEGAPSPKYLDVIKRAYRAWGFDRSAALGRALIRSEEDRIVDTTCPRCGVPYAERPALSRLDNQTNICPPCGLEEALIEHGVIPREPRRLEPAWRRRMTTRKRTRRRTP